MYRKLMWCYVLVLTLLDISLNSKLTAQGKSHGVTVHESLVEGITFQEWGSAAGAGADGPGSGRALPAGALRAWPPALALGRAALGAARAATVTLTNTANATMHLASVAGTTPDFHASFFDSKTLACGANTSFSVVYLGRREGPVSAHLYIHTSLGVHKYPVSAVGVASEWGLWPLVGVRVPHNATLTPLLTLHNPTPHTVQVQEIYSSAGWLGLQLPGGAASAPRALWAVPPHSSRALVRLRLAAPPAQPGPRAAYIRIKANVTGPPLVVVVEALATPAGAHAQPLQLRAGTRGSRDPPYTFEITMGNSEGAWHAVSGAALPPRCRAAPHAPPPPAPRLHNGDAAHTHNGAAEGAEGAQLSFLRTQLEPHQEPEPAAEFTLDFAKLWARGISPDDEETEPSAAAGEERWCAGWCCAGGGSLPYSVRLLPGTLRLPPHLHFVTANEEECMKPQELRAVNEFAQPLLVASMEYPPELLKYFEVESMVPAALPARGEALLARLRLRRRARAQLDAHILLRTNLTHTGYSVRVQLYSGRLQLEWDWPGATPTELDLGVVPTSSTRRIVARVSNDGPAPLCVTPHAALPGATLVLDADCVPPHQHVQAVLTVVAPARPGAVSGAVWFRGEHAAQRTTLQLRARAGQLRASLLPLAPLAAAPFAEVPEWTLSVESSMGLRMRLERVESRHPDPAVEFIPPATEEASWVEAGGAGVPAAACLGRVRYVAERACGHGARCYSGGAGRRELRGDEPLLRTRRALFEAERAKAATINVSLWLHTNEMVRIPVSGSVQLTWPQLVRGAGEGAGWAGLAGVGAAAARWLRVRNPSPAHALLLRAHVARHSALPAAVLSSAPQCVSEECVYSEGVFTLAEWRAPHGGVSPLEDEAPGAAGAEGAAGGSGDAEDEEGKGGIALLLAPRAVAEFRVDFTPAQPALYHAHFYLRNNLTIVEAIELAGRGAVPSFELAGRRAGAAAPLLLQVDDCSEGEECPESAEGPEGRWTVRRTLLARNTGAVPLRLRGWRLAGAPCRARGFRLEPCAPLALAPNESRALTLAFRADCTLARVPVALTLRAGAAPAAFRLLAAVPARLLPACARALPRPPWEPALRQAGALLALAALALVLAAAALDAERLLRRARCARGPPAPAPLDLRRLARAAPAPPPPARRRRPRKPLPALPAQDPRAERRAFERWRAEVLRRDAPRAPREERSGDERDPPPAERHAEPDTDDREERDPRSSSGDEDAASTTATDSSSPAEEPEGPEGPPPAEPAPGGEPPPPRSPPRAEPAPAEGARAAGAPRARREASPPARRGEAGGRGRAPPGKHHARKDKASKRRGERPAAAPARPPPTTAEARAGGGALRWGASWSSVVAAGAPPPAPAPAPPPAPAAPAPRAAPDQSLFYFNDAAHSLRAAAGPTPAPAPDYAWRGPERSPFVAPAPAPRDYLEEPSGLARNAYGTIGSGWGGAAAAAGERWAWRGAGVRPPPGFGPRHAPPPVRAYDPFHSLASIWAPGAFDWRVDREPPPPPPPAH